MMTQDLTAPIGQKEDITAECENGMITVNLNRELNKAAEYALVFSLGEQHVYTAAVFSGRDSLGRSFGIPQSKAAASDRVSVVDIMTDRRICSANIQSSAPVIPLSDDGAQAGEVSVGLTENGSKEGSAAFEEAFFSQECEQSCELCCSDEKEAVQVVSESPGKASEKRKKTNPNGSASVVTTSARREKTVEKEPRDTNPLDIFERTEAGLLNDDVGPIKKFFPPFKGISLPDCEFYAFDKLISDKNDLKIIYSGFAVPASSIFLEYKNAYLSVSAKKSFPQQLVGIRYNGVKVSEFIFACAGKNTPEEQPFGGVTGFGEWTAAASGKNGEGYWLLRLDAETGKIK